MCHAWQRRCFPSQVYDEQSKAATAIEGAMRKHLAKKRVASMQELKMYNTLDNHEEHVRLGKKGA